VNYLLDVNALIALGLQEHEFHQRVSLWVHSSVIRSARELATCSITELGFIRIVAQTPQYGVALSQARELLLELRKSSVVKITFVADALDTSQLPSWVKSPKQTTDGHLLQLAQANGLMLATLDSRIPGAYLIPEN